MFREHHTPTPFSVPNPCFDGYVFQVVALANCQCLCSMSPVPILFTTTTTIDEVKEEYLKVWKLRQLIEAERKFSVALYNDQEGHRLVSTAGQSSFFVNWVVEGLAPTVHARVVASASRPSSRTRLPLSGRADPPADQRVDSPPIFPISIKLGSLALDDFHTHRFVRVEQLKRILEAREGIPAQHQTLLYQGQAMDDSRTLVSYGVTEENDHELHLSVGGHVKRSDVSSVVRIFVKTLTAKLLMYHITPCFTAAELKLLIQDDQGVHEDLQRLIFAGKQLEAGEMLMSHDGIRADSTLHLVLRVRGC